MRAGSAVLKVKFFIFFQPNIILGSHAPKYVFSVVQNLSACFPPCNMDRSRLNMIITCVHCCLLNGSGNCHGFDRSCLLAWIHSIIRQPNCLFRHEADIGMEWGACCRLDTRNNPPALEFCSNLQLPKRRNSGLFLRKDGYRGVSIRSGHLLNIPIQVSDLHASSVLTLLLSSSLPFCS